jgi:CheY-like chemotaxis protein
VILNLAVNARGAMHDGGRLSICTDRAAGTHGTEDVVVVRVSDTGHGMEAETQRRVFEPFFTTKPVGEGTGLGLAMVYGVITQSGGTISVSSAPEQGTTFEIRLPVASASDDEPVHVPAVMPSVRFGEATILLAEDDPSVRGTVERALLDAGYRVLVASDGDEALRLGLAHLQELDLLLTDVVMPTLSGPLLSERLLAERPNLQVVLMSGYSEQLFGTDGVWDERASFIEKPFTPHELIRRIEQALGRG